MPWRVEEPVGWVVSSSLGGVVGVIRVNLGLGRRSVSVWVRHSKLPSVLHLRFLRSGFGSEKEKGVSFCRCRVKISGNDCGACGSGRVLCLLGLGKEKGTSLCLNSVSISLSVECGSLSGWYGCNIEGGFGGRFRTLILGTNPYWVIFFINTSVLLTTFLVEEVLVAISLGWRIVAFGLLRLGKQLSIEGEGLGRVEISLDRLDVSRTFALVWYNRLVSWVNTLESLRRIIKSMLRLSLRMAVMIRLTMALGQSPVHK